MIVNMLYCVVINDLGFSRSFRNGQNESDRPDGNRLRAGESKTNCQHILLFFFRVFEYSGDYLLEVIKRMKVQNIHHEHSWAHYGGLDEVIVVYREQNGIWK